MTEPLPQACGAETARTGPAAIRGSPAGASPQDPPPACPAPRPTWDSRTIPPPAPRAMHSPPPPRSSRRSQPPRGGVGGGGGGGGRGYRGTSRARAGKRGAGKAKPGREAGGGGWGAGRGGWDGARSRRAAGRRGDGRASGMHGAPAADRSGAGRAGCARQGRCGKGAVVWVGPRSQRALHPLSFPSTSPLPPSPDLAFSMSTTEPRRRWPRAGLGCVP